MIVVVVVVVVVVATVALMGTVVQRGTREGGMNVHMDIWTLADTLADVLGHTLGVASFGNIVREFLAASTT
jgi:hypothetical protein